MNYYKICECQKILQFDKPYLCPDPCPYCGRMTQNYITYRGEPPVIQNASPIKDPTRPSDVSQSVPIPVHNATSYTDISRDKLSPGGEQKTSPPTITGGQIKSYYLSAADGRYQIEIPAEGGIVGRTGLGAEQLAHNNAVSKQHLKIMINKRLGVFIEDISSFGTKVNGEELIKGNRVLVKPGDHITLYNEELILTGR